ncbi:type I polyketide synthase [Nocardia sp. NPDC088792]|uniref:type I polyketide synthase n=1 Tax=Nocardia sp. NPDC088792 TaxID=3364332 RepID=UPI00381CFB2E
MLSDPIAVVGASCRFPGAARPAEFWRLLHDGGDAVTDTPADRRNPASFGMRGGFLTDTGEFDAEFFGISAREAAAMDPQQRLMLELGWEALEDARIIPARLTDTATGVFVGAISDDYATLTQQHDAITQHSLTGTNRGLIANRLSYVLGLRGPSMTIDAAQASSLVAVHLAVESLRRGETGLALAGGVQLNLSAQSTLRADRFGGLSPDGRCFVFDARANGFVRGEGGGLVVLKRLADALDDGDRIYCVIRGSAVNNDGGGANLTAPNEIAQQELLRLAYREAGVDPALVDYVELHGTGTKVGDPVEAAALGAVIGTARPDGEPLAVGSVKTNIGHLEGAAGIAGLLKTVLSIHHRALPASLNFETPNPSIPLDALNLRVQQSTTPWNTEQPRVAGVSSFGVGGTNCHVVLAEHIAAESQREQHPPAVAPVAWMLSGRDAKAVRGQAESLRAHLQTHPDLDVADIGYSLAATRTAFEHRAALVGHDPRALLDAFADGAPVPDLVRGVAGDGTAVFVFPGQGSQWAGMGVELASYSTVFADRMRDCADALAPHVDWSLTEVLQDAEALERVDVVQPALWAVMVSLAELWQSLGVRPSAVIGHSQGEIAAACVAGALSLTDAARIVAVRSRLLSTVAGSGAMASIAIPADRVEPGDGLSIAAINGPNAVVVSGESAAVDAVVSRYQAVGVRARRIAVDYASHSAEVEPIRAGLLAELAAIRPRQVRIPMLSTVTGEWAEGTALDAEYWYRNLREPVRLDTAVRALTGTGRRVFIEAAPHPVLATGIQETSADAVVVESLRRDDGGRRRFLTSLAQAWAHGVEVDAKAVFAGTGARPVELPTYAFQRRRYWFDEAEGLVAEQVPSAVRAPGGELDLVRAHAAAVLGQTAPEEIDAGLPFQDLGIDSHLAVELRNRLSAETGLALPATLLFDYPTCTAVAAFLQEESSGEHTQVVAPESRSAVALDPIAIVAMSCRLPGGVDSPEELWRLVAEGGDVIGEFPADRGWDGAGPYDPDPENAGTDHPRFGGFLDGAAEFDPAFFGISPREALAMDPQQRVLLELSWEALERAGIDPVALRGTRTGVFIGAMAQDYGPRLHEATSDGFLLTGNLTSVASGRLAYTYGLEGPAVTVDTACSSSLLALHLACQSLRQGESSLALAGGVTVMANPGMFVEFSRQRGLSPDGRCKAFAAAADGTGWSEGAGLLVLERLSDAQRNGHRVLAVVRGSAINQDGASNGLTAPNGPSQQRVIRQALANAGLSAGEVDAVEAHGTGTTLGDPIEAQAVLATYGQDRDHPLWLGSLKSNIGHTQAAAGVAGVIKMVLALQHGMLPKTLHVDAPSPHVDWTAGAVELLTAPTPWPRTTRPRRAGVSSFGISGTNAHLIIEEPTAAADVSADAGSPVVPWVLSAKTDAALRVRADQLRSLAEREPDLDLADAGRTLATGSVFDTRAVVIAANRAEMLSGLAALAEDPITVATAGDRGEVVFVFPGQGSQWPGMALELAAQAPVFAERLRECGSALSEFVDWSLVDVLADEAALERVDVVQPALWAVMVSLAALWRSNGVEPAAVVGHSQGEIAAAVVAGGLSLADGARIVALRSRALLALSGRGGMLSVSLPADAIRDRLGERLSLAAVNGPESVVVSGDPDALDALQARCAAEGIRARRIPVDYASHSAHVEEIRAELADLLSPVRPRSAAIPFYSAVTGAPMDTAELDAEYWYRNLRETVQFERVTRALIADGHRVFIETSAHPVLAAAVQESLDATDSDGLVTGSLRRDEGDLRRFLTSLGEAFAGGVSVRWATLFPGTRRVDLPTYPFQRQRYWLHPERAADPVDARFWVAVEQQDLAYLESALRIAPDRPLSEFLPALSSWRRDLRDRSTADSWRYQVSWKALAHSDTQPSWPSASDAQAPATGAPDPQILLPGTWLVVATPEETELTAQLAERGAKVLRLVPGDDVAAKLAGIGSIDGVLSLLAADDAPHPDYPAVPRGYAMTLALIQALGMAGIDAPLWCVTRGAVSVSGETVRPDQALLWGLGRVAALELPDRWGGLIDLPQHWDERIPQRMVSVLTGTEDQVAVRPDAVFGRRLVRAPMGRTGFEGWTPSGTVLITGGTGALGAHTARWLAAGGAEHVVLVSRRGPQAEGVPELVAELRELGTEVTVRACDIADRVALAELVASLPALDAVVHTAAVLDDGVIDALSLEQVDRVLRVKARAAWDLHELTETRNLKAFVVFSSLAGVVGTPGQGNYAPGNAYLDALALHRRSLGLPATAIAWGPWAGEGMGRGEFGAVARRHGVPMMRPAAAVTALRQILESDESGALVADIDWDRFGVAFTATRPSPLLTELIPAVEAPVADERDARSLLHVVRQQAATVLGYADAESVPAGKAFKDLGLDSVTAVDLRNRLVAATGQRLSATAVYDYPTAHALAEFLSGTAETTERPTTAAAEDEPIAIVGMACRFPGGVRSPEELWRLVVDGKDVVSGFPADRGWDAGKLAESGRLATRQGAFLYDAMEFDAGFFGVMPREAVAMDPQQRLLLETTWEAFERAGIDPSALRGDAVGVYAGTNGQDYASVLRADGGERFDGYLATGTSAAVLSGRVAYAFGFEGPAVTVDTACSSALVALHLAAESLRKGDCSLAVAGGVTVMSTPDLFVEFSRQGGLAPDGRCKAFSADADGTAWGEGVGVLIVERLSDAHRNGHPVLAVVRGSAVNQDGASNGLTAPNGPAQQRVIRQALTGAGLSARDVDAVEAHGTGTTLGDPIEAQALLATYGQDREHPLWLGSIKSNIGHTQAAAGVAGVIKMVMAMRHGILPATLHAEAPTPHVDWSSGAVELLTESRAWPEVNRPRRAGISSFGISGTNAHVVLEADATAGALDPVRGDGADPEATGALVADVGRSQVSGVAGREVVPWVLSGKGQHALRAQAARLADAVESGEPHLLDVAFSLATTRAAVEDRAVVLGTSRAELLAGLRALAHGTPSTRVIEGTATEGKLAFLFSGQGAQRLGMGRELYEAFSGFANAFDEVCAALDLPLRQVIWGDDPEPLNRTDYAQSGLFAVEVALFRLLEGWGLHPDFLLGHSIGELAAAHVAGVLSLSDAAVLVTARGRLMQALPLGGVMVAVLAPEAELRPLLVDGVSIAAVNGPNAVVLSGDEDAVRSVIGDRKAKQLRVSHAFHSARMEPMLDEFRQVASGLSYQQPRIPLVSNVTGQPIERYDAEYWVRHVRDAVRFADGMGCLAELGVHTFLELGPDGTLAAMGRACLPEAGFAPMLRKGRTEPETVISAVAQLYTRGISPDWAAMFPGARTVALPTYAFQRQRYWPELTESGLDSLLYGIDWWPLAETDPPALSGTWLVAGPADHDLVDACTAALARHGATVRRVTDLAEARGTDADGVLSLLALDETRALADTLALLNSEVGARLWCVTRGAVSIGAADVLESPAQAQVWGLGRVAAVEFPARWGGLIDLPEVFDEHAQARLVQVLSGAAGDDQVAVRPSGLYGRRLTRAIRKTLAARTWRPRGTVLITGGTGALGAHVARWLARNGAEQLVLTSRRGASAPGAIELVAELTALGTRATVVACDVADRAALAAVLADHPVDAVVHAAGLSHIAPLSVTTPEEIAEIAAGKLLGAQHLDELLGDRELDAFVLFSSVSAVWGVGGLGAYAAGNAYLDALAQHRRARGLTATSIAWGPWDDGGMVEAQGERDPLRRRGVPVLAPTRAIAALQQALDHDETFVAVADVDWARFARLFTLERPSPMLAGIPEAGPAPEPAGPVRTDEPLAVDDTALLDATALLDLVCARVAEVVGHTGAQAVEPGRSFHDIGFDSLTAVELRDRLSADTGLALPATLVFDHPTPVSVAEYLSATLHGGRSSVPAAPATVAVDDDPIAIIGMSCRFPGGIASPEDLWQVVRDGVDVLSEFPADRGWDLRSMPAEPRAGGFVRDATDFDAAFFGISPREALTMDPQQRLLLEAAWEVFERAGIDPVSVRGSQAGVFIGAANSEYGPGLTGAADSAEGYALTGSVTAVASGRIAYTFGLEGPAVTLDTACSSSLVALHLAGRSLRHGECSMALVGGVAVMSQPGAFIDFARQGGLADDGRCKAFSAAADGTGWSEGVGMVLVERLSDARRNGHRVLAVVRGSAINQDGASNGLTAPNGPAQQRVIRAALADAQLGTADIDAVEAHGTGTKLGDPIEAQALLATYGQDRERPLWLGSVKSNIGHAQAAAGMSGIIKTVLALRHAVLPRTLHIGEPTPHVDWSAGTVSLLTEQIPWPETGRPRRAAVSAFGMSGTNAHTILEQAPQPSDAVPVPNPHTLADGSAAPDKGRGPVSASLPWIISAKTDQAIRAAAQRLSDHPHGASSAEIGYSLTTTRSLLDRRAVVIAADETGFRAGLDALARGESAAHVVLGTATAVPGRTAFVFPGQGSQWAGMALELLDSAPVFAARMADCAQSLRPFTDWTLTDALGDEQLLERVDVVQPALWAVMVSLAALWQSFGVRPAAVAGHSQGEIAAACVAGGLSLEDGARVVALRSKALLALSGRGGMMSVALSANDIQDRLGTSLSLAAVNGPNAVVVSGAPDALDTLLAELTAEGVRARLIPVDYASHSAQVEAIQAELATALAPVTPRPSDITFVSALTGKAIDTTELTGDYWYRNLRETVRFEEAIRTLAADGYGIFVETSAHPVLTAAVSDTAPDAVTVGSLRRADGGMTRFLTSLAEAFVRGAAVDWTPILPAAAPVELPTYPFQRQRFWLETRRNADPVDARFWEAVEQQDLTFLESALNLAADRPLSDVLPALSSWRRGLRDRSIVDSWSYRVDWKPLAHSEFPRLAGTWLVVSAPGTDRRAIVDALASHGAAIVELETAGADRDALARRLPKTPFSGVLSLLALDDLPHPEHAAVPRGYATSLALVQALGSTGIDVPLWCVTRGAVSVSGEAMRPDQALLWGLGRVAALELPDRWGGLIDLPQQWDAQTPERVANVLIGTEDQVAVRPDGVFGRRLVHAHLGRNGFEGWTPSGTVLITGGTGALGAHTARWLAAEGAEHVVLVSRHGPEADGATQLAAELRALGTEVTVRACDVADRAALAELIASLPALDAVVHTAAVLEDGVIDALTLEQVDRVLRVKARAAWDLHELTMAMNLKAFVVFSSLAGVVGTPGQGNYAPGNAYLDALAEHRRAQGLPATAVAWGPWAGGGMAERGVGETARRHGVPEMAPQRAISALRQVLEHGEHALTVAEIDWDRFYVAFTATRPSPLLADLPEAARLARAGGDDEPVASALTEQLAGAGEAEQQRVLVHLIRTQVATVLGHGDIAGIESGSSFSDFGFDSVTAVEFRNRLAAATGIRLPVTAVFDYPTPQSLATSLRAELVPAPADPAAAGIAELERLEAILAATGPDTAAALTTRLEALLATCKQHERPPAEAAGEEIESATAEELFDILHKEFGKSVGDLQ